MSAIGLSLTLGFPGGLGEVTEGAFFAIAVDKATSEAGDAYVVVLAHEA